jgi:Na+/proline symporter
VHRRSRAPWSSEIEAAIGSDWVGPEVGDPVDRACSDRPAPAPRYNRAVLAALTVLDGAIVAAYLVAVVLLGVFAARQAQRGGDAYFLADRNVPWWMLGLAGCSSYIDISNTMAMIGILFYLGLQGVWFLHVVWGWFIICFYMAFQAKWIRRSGVMTFAEWNRTRFGDGSDTEFARLVAAVFLLVLMVFNLMTIAVGIGKFAETLLGMERWLATLLVFGVVGIYTTLGGFFGVLLTDMLQTALIAVGAVLLSFWVLTGPDPAPLLVQKDPAWSSLQPVWNLWDGYAASVPAGFRQYEFLGPLLLGSAGWLVCRVLAGPNVWDFQFFLTARSARDAALAGGVWTIGYTLRWILGVAFLVLGLQWLQANGRQHAVVDGEQLMPLVLGTFPAGIRGLFVAVLLAALMSTLDAMVNITSSVVTNDFVRRYTARRLGDKAQVRIGQAASVGALALGCAMSFSFTDVAAAWEVMIFVVVTAILVPATMRWHWWRFSARAFALSVLGTAAIVAGIALGTDLGSAIQLPVTIGASLVLCLWLGFLLPPADRNVLVRFYASVRPFGVWGPVRADAVAQGLVPANDPLPRLDVLNGFLTMGLQVALCLVPFYGLLWRFEAAGIALAAVLVLLLVLWFTWYRVLPPRDEAAA